MNAAARREAYHRRLAFPAHRVLGLEPLKNGQMAYIYFDWPEDSVSREFRDSGFMKIRFKAEVDDEEVGVVEVRWVDADHFFRLFPTPDDFATLIPEMWSGYAKADPELLKKDYLRHKSGLNDPFVTWARSESPRLGIATLLYKHAAAWLADMGMRLRASTGQSPDAEKLWASFEKNGLPVQNEGGHKYLDYRKKRGKVARVFTVQNLKDAFKEAYGDRAPEDVWHEIVEAQNQKCVGMGWLDGVQPLPPRRVAGEGDAYKSKKKVKNQKGEESVVYEYSESHVQKRTEKKVDKVNHLSKSIDDVVAQAKKDLKSEDLKVKMPALAVLLINHTYERVGNEGSAEDGHYGVTTWKKKHLKFSGGKATLTYVGKSGVDHVKEVSDATIVSELKALAKGKGDNDYLFCDTEEQCSTRASEVNEYLKQFDITSKDLRGYHANRIMLEKLKDLSPAKDEKDRKRQFLDALDATAEEVGHEAATLRSQYLAPSVEEDFMDDGKVNKSVRASVVVSLQGLVLRVPNPRTQGLLQDALSSWQKSYPYRAARGVEGVASAEGGATTPSHVASAPGGAGRALTSARIRSLAASEGEEMMSFAGLLRALKEFMDLQSNQAATLRDLIAAGEARRLGRTTGIQVLRLTSTSGGLISADMKGLTGEYQTRIRMDPRGHHCTCEDWQKNGRRVGPCKHVLTLGQTWLTQHVIPSMEKLNLALMAVLEGAESYD